MQVRRGSKPKINELLKKIEETRKELKDAQEGIGDYVAWTGTIAEGELIEGVKDFQNPHASHEFAWGIGDIVTAFLDAGMQLKVLREYSYSNGFRMFDGARELPDRRFTMPEGKPVVAMMYGIVVQKPEA